MAYHVEIAGDRHLETLRNCGGYYSCPKGSNGERLGPLVGYAGKYQGSDGKQLQFVGDVYANFAKAETYYNVRNFFAKSISEKMEPQINMDKVDVLCGAPIGGYSLSDAIGSYDGINSIKAEKKVIAVATPTEREKSMLVFARHSVEKGLRYVIVEDVCNNFSTTEELINLIRAGGGEVLAIVCFLNRSLTVNLWYQFTGFCPPIPVISLVRQPINEFRQDDPAVAEDVAKGNVAWKPKDEWDRLTQAMSDNPR